MPWAPVCAGQEGQFKETLVMLGRRVGLVPDELTESVISKNCRKWCTDRQATWA